MHQLPAQDHRPKGSVTHPQALQTWGQAQAWRPLPNRSQTMNDAYPGRDQTLRNWSTTAWLRSLVGPLATMPPRCIA